jgi:DNA-binding transcriptional ArsR family regulator
MTEDQAQRIASTLAVLASPMRILMIQAMAEGELTVGKLADKTGLSRTATYQHVLKLRGAGVLVQRKHNQSRYCAIRPSISEPLHRLILIAAEQEAKLRRRQWCLAGRSTKPSVSDGTDS